MSTQDDSFRIHPGQKSLQVCYYEMHESEETLSTTALHKLRKVAPSLLF